MKLIEISRYKYVQNRKHWCWAVACKMVGEQYKKIHPNYDFSIITKKPKECGQVTTFEFENGVVTNNLDGINWELQRGNEIKVDAWQRAIVMNANTTKYQGYDGDVDGDDEAKIRGIKYYLTGDIYSNKVKIETIGYYDDEVSVFDTYKSIIMASFQREEYVIGNAVLHGGREYHSFVIMCIQGKKVMMYDPANGEILYHNVREIFYDGFKNHLGTGIIRWIQRIC